MSGAAGFAPFSRRYRLRARHRRRDRHCSRTARRSGGASLASASGSACPTRSPPARIRRWLSLPRSARSHRSGRCRPRSDFGLATSGRGFQIASWRCRASTAFPRNDRHPSRRILRGRGPEFQGAAWRYCESSCRPSASEVVAETELPAAGRSCRFRRGRAGICFSIPPHRHGRVGREPRARDCCAQRLGAAAMVQTERMADLGRKYRPPVRGWTSRHRRPSVTGEDRPSSRATRPWLRPGSSGTNRGCSEARTPSAFRCAL